MKKTTSGHRGSSREGAARILLAGTALSVLCLSCPALAQTTSWDGSESTDWFDPDNWNNGVPAPSFTVNIDTIASNPTVVNGGNASANPINIGVHGKGALTVENGGTLASGQGIIGYFSNSEGIVTVTGTGSSWTSTGNLLVGQSGEGALIVENGGLVTANVIIAGHYDGSEGTIRVEGGDSRMTSASLLRIGDEGIGNLLVAGGGTVSNTSDGFIGAGVNSRGEATVTGPGSQLNNSGQFYVGGEYNGAVGILTLADDGALNVGGGSGTVWIAYHSGATGTLNIGAASGENETDAGTLNAATVRFGSGTGEIVFNHDESAYVFAPVLAGGGTVRVEAGHTSLTGNNTYTGNTILSGGTLTLGHDNALGTSTLTTTGSVVDYADGVNIGNAVVIDSNTTQFQVLTGSATHSGVISEQNGPRPFKKIGAGELILTNDNLWTGQTTVSEGTLTFDGGSVDLSSNNLIVSDGNAAATLNIKNGGEVGNGYGLIGHSAVSTGTVTVTGANSSWTSSINVAVGYYGNGTLTVEDGGEVANVQGYVGDRAGSDGTATVTGPGSVWTNSGLLSVGNFGTGVLNIANGGAVSSAGGFIADQADSSGEVTVTGLGSVWADNGVYFFVGREGEGKLTIEDRGQVLIVNGVIANEAGSSGEVAVSGAGSAWINSGNLAVGNSGDAVLAVSGGSAVSNVNANIGYFAAGSSKVTVDGAGSTWTNTGELNIGTHGGGTVDVTGGGAVSSATGYIGRHGPSNGTVTVTGAGSSWTNSNGLHVGDSGIGVLTIANGGAVSNTYSYIGHAGGSNGTVSVTGSTSTWTSSNSLTVGYDGTGTLNIADDGTVDVVDIVDIASNAGSIGTLNIGAASGDAAAGAGTLNAASVQFGSGTGKIVFNHNDGAYDFAADISGRGSVLVENGTSRLTGDSSGFSGTTSVAGGHLRVEGSLGGAVAVDSGATLSGTGTLGGSVEVGGTLSAGNSPGTLTIVGNLTLNASSISIFELGAPGVVGGAQNDLVVVGGNLTLGGALQASVSAAGYYRLFNYGGTLAGSFGTETIVSSDPGFSPASHALMTDIPGQVNMMALGAGQHMQFWDGADEIGNGIVDGGSGTWDRDANWTGAPGSAGINDTWRGSVGVFAGAAGGTVTIGSPGSFDTLQFATDGYVLTGGDLTMGPVGTAATLNVDGGVTATVQSAIVDGGNGYALIKAGAGTLILSGVNNYTGGTTISAGTLIGDTTSLQGNIVNDAALVFDQSAAGTFAGMISGSGSLTKQGTGALTLTGANSYGGGTTVSAGTLIGDTTSLQGNIVNDAALVFDQSAAGTFAGMISGSGSLTKQGIGALTLIGDSSGFAGITTVTGGELVVNGALGGILNMNGGTLGGSGSLGNVILESGARLTPGNSIGTLNVVNYTFNPGSIYEVELDDGGFTAGTNSDLLNATGTVTINGGTVHVTPENGTDDGSTYTPGTYTIITAATGVAGVGFDAVTDDYAFLDFTLDYPTANRVDLISALSVTPATGFCVPGMSLNQCAAGDGAFSMGAGNSVYDAVLTLSNAEAPVALGQLSGEIHASARTALLEDSRFLREAAMDRLRVALGGTAANDSAQIEKRISESFGLWGQGFGSWSQQGSNGSASGMDRSIGGFLMGGDALVWDNMRFGVLGGYARSGFSAGNVLSTGTADTYTLGAYGGGKWDAFALSGGLAHSWHSLDMARSVAFTGFSDNLSVAYSARTLQAWGEAAYSFEAGASRFEPFANLAYVTLSTNSFTETGGAAALTSASNVVDATFATLGLRAETDVAFGDMGARLHGMVGWRHAFGGAPTAQMTFASGGNAFTIVGVPLAQDSLVLNAGIDINLTDKATLGIAYGGQFGSGVQDHSAKVNLNVRF